MSALVRSRDDEIGILARFRQINWLLILLLVATASVGFAVLSGAEPGAVAFIQAFAAGAILAMLSESMVPEAQEIGGRAVGLATSLGFAVAASLSFVT